MKKKKITKNLFLYIPLIIIMIISFFNMYNAKFLSSSYNNHLIKQILWYFIGFLILFIFNKINLKNIFKYSFLIYLFSILLLILVLLFGKEINGARAWFSLKFFSFQPSELMKLGLSLYIPYIVSKSDVTSFKNEIILIIKIVFITLIPSILVFLEPDTGAIIIYIIIAATILLTSKIRKRLFIPIVILAIIIIITFMYLYFNNQDILINILGTSFFYRVERIMSFTNNTSLQLENALVAIGSSSFLGCGIGKTTIYIPEAPTDFIVAFTISNFGYLGITLTLISYLVLDLYLLYCYKIINDKKSKYFLISFIGIFLFQQFENILMNIGLMPIMGIPLPFLSYGGTTILIYFIFIGIVLKNNKTESV